MSGEVCGGNLSDVMTFLHCPPMSAVRHSRVNAMTHPCTTCRRILLDAEGSARAGIRASLHSHHLPPLRRTLDQPERGRRRLYCHDNCRRAADIARKASRPRVEKPSRCAICGTLVEQPATGRPRKYCDGCTERLDHRKPDASPQENPRKMRRVRVEEGRSEIGPADQRRRRCAGGALLTLDCADVYRRARTSPAFA